MKTKAASSKIPVFDSGAAWSAVIGLQAVDGLVVSDFLPSVAVRQMSGSLSLETARQIVDGHFWNDATAKREGESDRVAVRMIATLASDDFELTPAFLCEMHLRCFSGVFGHAGRYRDVNLLKRETILDGDSVLYAPHDMIAPILKAEFRREGRFDYSAATSDAALSHLADFVSKLWQIHPFREGNTRTVAVFAVKYLQSLGCTPSIELFATESRRFRDALVLSNYDNMPRGIVRDKGPLLDFLQRLVPTCHRSLTMVRYPGDGEEDPRASE